MKSFSSNTVSISKGNSKMGLIPSVSLPPEKTCLYICKGCYARKGHFTAPSVRNSLERNWRIYTEDREKFWREVEAAIMVTPYFRFHVAGDIPDADYLRHIISLAQKYPCEILIFTKKYELCNEVTQGLCPSNLHLIYSGWKGIEMKNPYHFPEAHVLERDGSTTARDGARWCSGNCMSCYVNKCGCFTLKYGEQVMFRRH